MSQTSSLSALAERMTVSTDYPPPGQVLWRAQEDRHGNGVSLLTTACGRRMRLVHHSKPGAAHQRGRVMWRPTPESRWQSMAYKSYSPSSDCREHTVAVGGYGVSWGDGDNLGGEYSVAGVDLTRELGAVQDDDFAAVLLTVADRLPADHPAWQVAERGPVATGTAAG